MFFLSRLDCNYTWLSLDEHDNDPLKFISYLLAAIRKINKRFGTMIEDLMTAPKLPGAETVSLYLARELEQVQEPFILVLDDYQVIHNAYINEACFQITKACNNYSQGTNSCPFKVSSRR
jgi:LuxR family maltose regulon positive regulatory protein